MLLFQTCMPCSDNFNRYKKNYEKFLTSNPGAKDEPWSQDQIVEIASPKFATKLGPLS